MVLTQGSTLFPLRSFCGIVKKIGIASVGVIFKLLITVTGGEFILEKLV